MTYVLSDVHGYYNKFLTMLEKINFSDNDVMIVLGDVIDRGPEGITMIQDIMKRKNVVMTMGNHELMMVQSLLGEGDEQAQKECAENWIQNNGGYATMLQLEEISDEEALKIMDFITKLPVGIDLTIGERKFHLVHGWPCEDVYDALWSRPELDTLSPLEKDIQLIIGHTPTLFLHAKDQDELWSFIKDLQKKREHFKIEHASGFIDLDCGLAQNITDVSVLACLRLDDMHEFYV
ncbi:MAG: fructose-bisphosphatase class III [Lachnospiraceae bacterium]|nr:fructose-bisphosphatase class III [Lachnospiraceae bacterium]MCM1230659.1 fructose-bisphosphatase class III [Ruminococcus flavefaciens]MCM1439985.1 fructose-bisphosphatase class III [Roseburia sp.]